MGVKIQFFKQNELDVGERMSRFMEGVNTIENGILLGQDYVGVLYKDKEEIGMNKANLITAVSGELAKSQKQFITQEGLVRAYKDMISLFQGQQQAAKEKADACQVELDSYIQTYDPTLEKEIDEQEALLKKAEVAHQQSPKAKKEEMLKPIFDINNVLKELQPKFDAYKTAFDAKSSEISGRMGGFAVDSANLLGRVKENSGFLEDAISARDHAAVFIISSKKLIEDLKEGKVEGVE